MKQTDVENYCQANGFNHRKDQYRIMEQYFGVEAETIKEMMSFHRYLRDILPVDEVGLAKEKEWHTPQHLRTGEQEWAELFKRNALNI